MLPTRTLLGIDSIVKLVRLPISIGILPLRLLLGKFNSVTLSELTVTPNHVPSVLGIAKPSVCKGAVFQPVLFIHLYSGIGERVLLYNAISAALSDAGIAPKEMVDKVNINIS